MISNIDIININNDQGVHKTRIGFALRTYREQIYLLLFLAMNVQKSNLHVKNKQELERNQKVHLIIMWTIDITVEVSL